MNTPREAAKVGLRKLLDTKKRGDMIHANEIVESSGVTEWDGLRQWIKKYMFDRSLVIAPVPNDGYRVLCSNELTTTAQKLISRAARGTNRAVKSIGCIDRGELSVAELRRAEFTAVRAATCATELERATGEIRKEFKLNSGDRVPLRLVGEKKEA